MREIKFRGKGINSDQWVYGDLIHGVGAKSGNVYILPRQINLAYIKNCDPLDGLKVSPESVGQFTGLHDKNGKEIYENDIVKMTSPYGDSHTVCEIRFMDGGFVVEADGWFGESGSDLTTVGWAIEEGIEIEVIGNIHESPELLNK